MIIINSNTRQFNVPGADLVFGVSGDSGSEVKRFQCSRYVGNNLDLVSCFVRINFRNGNGKMDSYLVDDMAIDGDNVTFSWLLSPKVTEYRGQVKFVMCVVGPDLKLKWHTTQGTGQVMEGLEPDNSHVESQTADVVAQLIAMVEEQTTDVENTGADQVAAVKAAAETARTAAVNEIEAKRINSLESIPADYTALSATVDTIARTAAPGIVCSAAGEVITLNDASDQAFRSFRIFGKSTQDGTPTPENPVEIVSVGDGGLINTMVAGKNLLAEPFVLGVHRPGGYGANSTVISTEGMYLKAGAYVISVSMVSACNLFVNGMTDSTHTSDYQVAYGQERVITILKDGLYNIQFNKTDGTAFTDAELRAVNASAQLELGTTATAFEPYKGKNVTISTTSGLPGIPVTSGGNYTDADGQQWICDEVDFVRSAYVQRVGKLNVYNETVSDLGVSVTGVSHNFFINGEAYDKNPDYQDRLIPAICNKFIPTGYGVNSFVFSTVANSGWGGAARLVFRAPLDVNTVEQFKEYVGEDCQVLYQLKDEITTTLSEEELAAYRALHTNKPNTTILNDSGAYMSVDYTADTKLYIDNKIKEALL